MLGEKIFFLIGFIKEPEEPRSDSLLFVAVIVFDERDPSKEIPTLAAPANASSTFTV